MAFVYTGPQRIRDEETGVELFYSSSFRDGIDTFNYTIKDGEIQFEFEVVHQSALFPYLKDGQTKEGRFPTAIYILEDGFRGGLDSAHLQLKKKPPQQDDYERYKKIVTDGFTALITRNGEALKFVPSVKFQVVFVDNIRVLARQHPGLLKHYRLT